MTKETYLLEGLCCPNCAAKIDAAMKGLPGVKEAAVDFEKKRLSLVYEGDGIALRDAVIGIVRDVDEDVVVKAIV
jgi:Cd2+/Zn2+-exporting ATPase